MRPAMLLVLALFASRLRAPQGPPPPSVDSQIVAAKTAFLTSEILFPRTEKSSFATELDAILTIATSTKVWSVYKPAAASNADIIIKIVEDRSLGVPWTLTLHVYEPENNRELYKETREYVELTNDVHRLMNHLLNAVVEQRRLNKEEAWQEAERLREEEAEEKERAEKDFENGIGPAKITCDNVKLYANRGAERRIRRILNKDDLVTITVTANSEVVVKIGDVTGYVDARCVQVLPTQNFASKPSDRR